MAVQTTIFYFQISAPYRWLARIIRIKRQVVGQNPFRRDQPFVLIAADGVEKVDCFGSLTANYPNPDPRSLTTRFLFRFSSMTPVKVFETDQNRGTIFFLWWLGVHLIWANLLQKHIFTIPWVYRAALRLQFNGPTFRIKISALTTIYLCSVATERLSTKFQVLPAPEMQTHNQRAGHLSYWWVLGYIFRLHHFSAPIFGSELLCYASTRYLVVFLVDYSFPVISTITH